MIAPKTNDKYGSYVVKIDQTFEKCYKILLLY